MYYTYKQYHFMATRKINAVQVNDVEVFLVLGVCIYI